MDLNPCPVCGGRLEDVSVSREISIGTRSAVVLDQFFACAECAEELYAPGQMDATMRRTSDAIRRQEALLTSGEIREFRESLQLSQAAFEKLLGVGPKTVVRWEKGTVFQNAATDTLMRVIREVPDALAYLARSRGVAVPSGGVTGSPSR